MEDITERRRAEQGLVEAKEAAETASHAKGLFLANISHELRTPLNAILGYSEMLQEEADERKLPGEFSIDLEKINDAGKHLLAFINDILDLSQIGLFRAAVEQPASQANARVCQGIPAQVGRSSG
jgi:signal transduction histidine kinase